MNEILRDQTAVSALPAAPAPTAPSLWESDVWIYCAALIALTLKLWISFHTMGTNDVANFLVFSKSLHDFGLQWTYTHQHAFNHPPLVAFFLRGLYALHQQGLNFAFFLRLPGISADLVVVLLLTRMRRELALPRGLLIAFALSPVSLMVSGFHGNTDPVMVMFLVMAAAMCLRSRAAWCGLFLALSCQVKVIPLLLFPIFACFWFSRQRTIRFGGAFGIVSLLFWLLPLLKFPGLMVKNVLAYGSFWGLWGISYWSRLTGWREFGVISYHHLPLAESIVSTILKLAIIACVVLIAWRRRHLRGREFFNSLAYAWIAFFVLSPGIAPQYMVWLVPFVLVASAQASVALMISSSLFLFFFYNAISGGLPWYRGISTLNLADVWAPWTIWPWAALIAMALVFWRNAKRSNPSLRLLALAPVPHD